MPAIATMPTTVSSTNWTKIIEAPQGARESIVEYTLFLKDAAINSTVIVVMAPANSNTNVGVDSYDNNLMQTKNIKIGSDADAAGRLFIGETSVMLPPGQAIFVRANNGNVMAKACGYSD